MAHLHVDIIVSPCLLHGSKDRLDGTRNDACCLSLAGHLLHRGCCAHCICLTRACLPISKHLHKQAKLSNFKVCVKRQLPIKSQLPTKKSAYKSAQCSEMLPQTQADHVAAGNMIGHCISLSTKESCLIDGEKWNESNGMKCSH